MARNRPNYPATADERRAMPGPFEGRDPFADLGELMRAAGLAAHGEEEVAHSVEGALRGMAWLERGILHAACEHLTENVGTNAVDARTALRACLVQACTQNQRLSASIFVMSPDKADAGAAEQLLTLALQRDRHSYERISLLAQAAVMACRLQAAISKVADLEAEVALLRADAAGETPDALAGLPGFGPAR